MKKRFNYTGVCVPEKHYMADISQKVTEISQMVERGEYFVINRPRQYGKTTTIYMLTRHLKAGNHYFPINISFEAIGSESYNSEKTFIGAFLLRLKRVFQNLSDKGIQQFIEQSSGVDGIHKLDIWLTQLIEKIGKPTVLMIDEVDKSCNNQ